MNDTDEHKNTIVLSYVSDERYQNRDTIPRILFDVRAMATVKTATMADVTNVKYIAVSYSRQNNYKASFRDPAITWNVWFSSEHWLKDICDEAIKFEIYYIWIDALCINQDSDKDKEDQIPEMGSYYQMAEFVMVVLDDLFGSKDKILSAKTALHGIPEYLDFQPKYSNVPDWFQFSHFIAAHNICSIIGKSRWARRVWTVQEIRLCKKAVYYISGVTSFTDVQISTYMMLKYMGADSKIESVTRHMKELPIDIEPQKSLAVDSIMPIKNGKNFPYNAIQQLFIGREATIEQDKIYGMLGLVPYGRSMAANYNLTLEEIERDLYTIASCHGDNTWISGNGKRHRFPGWSLAMRSDGVPIPSIIGMFSHPVITDRGIDVHGCLCGQWSYVKDLVALDKPGPGEGLEIPITRTCTSIITAIAMKSKNLDQCINALKASFYLYGDNSDKMLASIIDRNHIFDNFISKFMLNGIGAWATKELNGCNEKAESFFANAATIINTWYRHGNNLSLVEINTDKKIDRYVSVAALEPEYRSGHILVIGLISKDISVCIPVIKIEEKLRRVGGVILIQISNLTNDISLERFQML